MASTFDPTLQLLAIAPSLAPVQTPVFALVLTSPISSQSQDGPRRRVTKRQHRPVIIAVGLFGAALIYGDGAITPAISVLSALEGLNRYRRFADWLGIPIYPRTSM